jgi:hypothetical protein
MLQALAKLAERPRHPELHRPEVLELGQQPALQVIHVIADRPFLEELFDRLREIGQIAQFGFGFALVCDTFTAFVLGSIHVQTPLMDFFIGRGQPTNSVHSRF